MHFYSLIYWITSVLSEFNNSPFDLATFWALCMILLTNMDPGPHFWSVVETQVRDGKVCHSSSIKKGHDPSGMTQMDTVTPHDLVIFEHTSGGFSKEPKLTKLRLVVYYKSNFDLGCLCVHSMALTIKVITQVDTPKCTVCCCLGD